MRKSNESNQHLLLTYFVNIILIYIFYLGALYETFLVKVDVNVLSKFKESKIGLFNSIGTKL